jgi:hypothetical protein
MHDSNNNIRYESLDRWRMDMGFEVERPLHVYESEQVEALHQLLSSANLLQDRNELKIWNSCPYGNFTVKSCSSLIDRIEFNGVCSFQTKV